MALIELNDLRTQKAKHFRDDVSGQRRAVLTIHDQHYDNAGWVDVDERAVLDGKDGYARKCDQMRHAIRYTEDGGRLWTPRRANPNEYIAIGAPSLLTPIGSVAESYKLTAQNLAAKSNSYDWTIGTAKVTMEHNWHKIKASFLLGKDDPTHFRWPIALTGGLTWKALDILAGDTVVARMLKPCAEDATGASLPVTWKIVEGYIEYSVDTKGAVFPVLVDPTFTDGYGGDVNTASDTRFSSGSPTSNYGSDASLRVSGVTRSGVMVFTLSSLSDVTVTSATLYMTKTGGSGTLTLNRILAANSGWTEMGATWNTKDGTNGWAGISTYGGCLVPGTDYDSDALGTMDMAIDNGARASASLDLDEFAAMVAGNYGIAFRAGSSDDVTPASSDHDTSGYRPVLTVEYTSGEAPATTTSNLMLMGVG